MHKLNIRMKRLCRNNTSICILGLLFLSTSLLKVSAQAPEMPEDLSAFVEKFTEAVLNHNTESIMDLMDVDYKQEQHDAFLKGDTQEFINRFFCGYDVSDGETYECMKLNEISKIEITTVIPDTELYIVLFHVSDQDSTIEITWMISAKPTEGTTLFGMIGTYG